MHSTNERPEQAQDTEGGGWGGKAAGQGDPTAGASSGHSARGTRCTTLPTERADAYGRRRHHPRWEPCALGARARSVRGAVGNRCPYRDRGSSRTAPRLMQVFGYGKTNWHWPILAEGMITPPHNEGQQHPYREDSHECGQILDTEDVEVQRREGVVCERGEVLVRLAEYGDSLGHNQVWGGSPDPRPGPRPAGRAGGGAGGRGGAGAPVPPLDCHRTKRASIVEGLPFDPVQAVEVFVVLRGAPSLKPQGKPLEVQFSNISTRRRPPPDPACHPH